MSRSLWFVCALALAGGGCFTCPSDSVAVNDDFDLTEAQVVALEEAGGTTRENIACESACGDAYRDRTGWMGLSVDDCAIDLDTEAGATPEAVVGNVHCEGTGHEYYCE